MLVRREDRTLHSTQTSATLNVNCLLLGPCFLTSHIVIRLWNVKKYEACTGNSTDITREGQTPEKIIRPAVNLTLFTFKVFHFVSYRGVFQSVKTKLQNITKQVLAGNLWSETGEIFTPRQLFDRN